MKPLGWWIDLVLLVYSAFITILHAWSGWRMMRENINAWEKIRTLEENLRKQKMLRRLGAPWREEEEDRTP